MKFYKFIALLQDQGWMSPAYVGVDGDGRERPPWNGCSLWQGGERSVASRPDVRESLHDGFRNVLRPAEQVENLLLRFVLRLKACGGESRDGNCEKTATSSMVHGIIGLVFGYAQQAPRRLRWQR